VAYTFFSPETLYIRQSTGPTDPNLVTGSSFKRSYLNFRRVDPTQLRIKHFLEPLSILGHFNILAASVAYAVVFNFVLVMLLVEIPIRFERVFHLNPQQTRINYLGLVG
jgi:hypothetical protein